jgi:hypothetical protein
MRFPRTDKLDLKPLRVGPSSDHLFKLHEIHRGRDADVEPGLRVHGDHVQRVRLPVVGRHARGKHRAVHRDNVPELVRNTVLAPVALVLGLNEYRYIYIYIYIYNCVLKCIR